MAVTSNSCVGLVKFKKKTSTLKPLSQNELKHGSKASMEGSVLSFIKAEWKVSDTGSAHWASSYIIGLKSFNKTIVDFWCQFTQYLSTQEVIITLAIHFFWVDKSLYQPYQKSLNV